MIVDGLTSLQYTFKEQKNYNNNLWKAKDWIPGISTCLSNSNSQKSTELTSSWTVSEEPPAAPAVLVTIKLKSNVLHGSGIWIWGNVMFL